MEFHIFILVVVHQWHTGTGQAALLIIRFNEEEEDGDDYYDYVY